LHDNIGFMRRFGAVLTATAMLSLSACGGADKKLGLSCFPKETQKWIWQAGAKGDANAKNGADVHMSQPVAAKMATIYVDRSGSMVGYLNGADNDNRPFQALLGNLPTVAKIAGTESQFRAFGRNISEPIAVGDAKALQSAGYYSCAKGTPCESSESHLDQVFSMVAAQKDELAIVVTDLWYDNTLDGTGGPSALQEPLTQILADGRSVAVYGIEAPFKGQIYDIPAGGTSETSTPHTGTHPLYVMVIGSKNDVMELDRQMERSGARVIREGLTTGAIKRSVFNIDPGLLRPANAQPISSGGFPDVRIRPFEAYPGLKVQQFALNTQNPRDKKGAKANPPQWVAPKPDDFLPNTVWQGDLKADIRVWQRSGDEQCGKWIDNGALVDAAVVPRGGEGEGAENGGGQFTFDLSKSALMTKMRRPGVYLISGQLTRTDVDSPNPANAWANDWSFASNEGGAVLAKRQAMFPTLNLNEVMRIMENALRTATQRANVSGASGVVGFTVLVKSED
jgi:hypothetical protein